MSRTLKLMAANLCAILSIGCLSVAVAPHLIVVPQTPSVNSATQDVELPRVAAVGSAFDPCATAFDAVVQPGATVQLVLSAPCAPDGQVVLRHAGLSFGAALDAKGMLGIVLPSLTASATFEAEFADKAHTATVAIPDFAQHERIALSWQGPALLHLGADRSIAGLDARGVVTRFTDPKGTTGHHIEILSRPFSGDAAPQPLSVLAEVTTEVCGRRVDATAIRSIGGKTLDRTTLSLELPDCDAVGDVLVLNNLLRDMKIASN